MEKFLKEYFHISAHHKISEKAILLRFATTIAVILFCLIAMGTTAFAYFSHNITSGSNIIKAANFEINVQITKSNGAPIEVRTSHLSHIAELTGGETYNITLQHTEQSTSQTGFVVISAKNCDSKYHTQQIGRNDNGTTQTIVFQLKSSADTEVTFYSHWGTSSYYPDFKSIKNVSDQYIQNKETVELTVKSTTDTNINENKKPSSNSETTEIEVTPETERNTPSDNTDSATPPVPQTTPPANTTEPEEISTTETTVPETNTSKPAESTTPQPSAPSETTDLTESVTTPETTTSSEQQETESTKSTEPTATEETRTASETTVPTTSTESNK